MSPGPARRVVYGPESQLRRPRQFALDTAEGFVAALRIAPRLTIRGLRSQYRSSLLGYFWVVGPALAVTGVWLYLNSVNVVNGGNTRIPYGVYVLVGTLLWMSFTEALGAPIKQLTEASNLLAKVRFPPESLLLAALLTVMINAMARLVMLVPVFMVSGVAPGWALVLFPIGLVALVIFGFAIGLVLAPPGALYRDVGQSLNIVTSFLFLVTPVAYVAPTGGVARVVSDFNPIRPLLGVARDWLTGGRLAPGPFWYAVVLGSLLLLGFGWILFRLSMPHLVDRMSP